MDIPTLAAGAVLYDGLSVATGNFDFNRPLVELSSVSRPAGERLSSSKLALAAKLIHHPSATGAWKVQPTPGERDREQSRVVG